MSIQFLFLFILLPSILPFELPFTIETIHDTFPDDDDSSFFRSLIQDDEIEFSSSSYDRLMVQLCIGKENQCIKTKLTSSSPYVWVVDKEIVPIGFDPIVSGATPYIRTVSKSENTT